MLDVLLHLYDIPGNGAKMLVGLIVFRKQLNSNINYQHRDHFILLKLCAKYM